MQRSRRAKRFLTRADSTHAGSSSTVAPDAPRHAAAAPSSDGAPHDTQPRLAARHGRHRSHRAGRPVRAVGRGYLRRHGRRPAADLQLGLCQPARRPAAGRHRAARLHLRLRPHRKAAAGALRVPEPRAGPLRRGAVEHRQRRRGGRGPHLLGQRRRRLSGHPAGRLRQPGGRLGGAGRLDHHPAGDQVRRLDQAGRGGDAAVGLGGAIGRAGSEGEPAGPGPGDLPAAAPHLPGVGPQAMGQGPGSGHGQEADRCLPGARWQGAHPRDLPEPDLLRERLVRDQGGGGQLLRHREPQRPDPVAGGLPGRPAAAAIGLRPLLPRPGAEAGHGAARPGAAAPCCATTTSRRSSWTTR